MFVVFEGIDGSGKTTVSNRVAKGLRARGISVKHLRAEGKFASTVTEAIRALGRDSRNVDLVPRAEFLLYVARDVQLIEEALRPAIAKNDVVLADRFLFTAAVLGGHARHLPPEYTQPVLTAAAAGLAPDLVILVDVDPTLARARRKAYKLATNDPRPPSRKGLGGVGIQHRMRQGYLELAAQFPDRWVVVSNEHRLETTVERVTDLVSGAIRDGAPTAITRFRAEERARVSHAPASPPLSSPADALTTFLVWVDSRMEREPQVAAYLLSGLFGPGVDERRRVLASRAPAGILAGLAGQTDDTSWELREALRGEHPALVARSLRGVLGDDPRLGAMRESLERICPAEVALSLGRREDEVAWAVRDRLFPAHPDVVIRTLKRMDTERAWAMRSEWLGLRRGNLETDYAIACAAVESVTGLDDPRAWELRVAVRETAPIAALASTSLLASESAWSWRERYLHRASKAVMGTVHAMEDPLAWAMRKAVVEDCKEAVDSIHALASEEAWDMREDCADRWPSTVVKSLGVLSAGPRGEALVTRQLARYPANISLLKHTSAIALGLRSERED
ncbi:MAG: dTMP kinase [Polyangiaceae bacterium]|nr:dTMP kinase [Polyangiaceae bacterium]